MPSERAVSFGQAAQKDPRLIELVLSEAEDVLRVRPGVIIVAHQRGWVLANAGIDRSNVEGGDRDRILLLPEDPDASAEDIRRRLKHVCGHDVGVIVADSIGRAWRLGTVGTAIGASGVRCLTDLRGRPDLYGRALETSEIGSADEIAAAASLLMGQGAEGSPVVVVRGLGRSDRRGPGGRPCSSGRDGPVPVNGEGSVLALCGGIGGAKVALGLSHLLPGERLIIACNTGDDFHHFGLAISPDIDTVIYTLAGLSNRELGWGREGETWQAMATLEALGGETWFRLGDADLALHLVRTQMLRAGATLSEVVDHVRRCLGVRPASSRRPTSRFEPSSRRMTANSASRTISCGIAARRPFARCDMRGHRPPARRRRSRPPQRPAAGGDHHLSFKPLSEPCPDAGHSRHRTTIAGPGVPRSRYRRW